MTIRVLTVSKPYVAAAYRDKLAMLAERDDFEVGLICPPRWDTQDFESGDSEMADVWLRTAPIHFNGHNHLHVYASRIRRLMEEFAPDVVNIEEEHYSLVTWQLLRYARRLGAKSLFYTWQNIQKRYPPPFSWIEHYVFQHVSAAVCGNEEAARILEEKGYRGPLRVIPQMGVDPQRFSPPPHLGDRRAEKTAMGLDPDKFWLGYFGRLVPEKGLDDLLAALEQLQDRPGVHVLLAGEGPHRKALEDHAANRGLAERVHFLGRVPSGEVAHYLRAVDGLCLPSRTRPNWKEQFGRILIEAMACGVVPIGSSSGEIPHVIGDAGFVFPEGSPEILAGCIRRLADSPTRREELARAGRERVLAKFSNDGVAAQMADLIRSL